ITAAAAASRALSRAGPFGSPMDRSSNVMPRTSAAARLALTVWNTFSLPCGNRDAGMDVCLLLGPVTSLLCPAGEPPREPGRERSQNTVWHTVRPLYSNKLPPDYIKIHYYQAVMRTALSWQRQLIQCQHMAMSLERASNRRRHGRSDCAGRHYCREAARH